MEGYDDSDRRIPDIAKVRTLIGWVPEYSVSELLERTMEYYVSEYKRNMLNNRKVPISG